MGKELDSFPRSSGIGLRKEDVAEEVLIAPILSSSTSSSLPPRNGAGSAFSRAGIAAGNWKKKVGGARLWMSIDRTGEMEVVECDRSSIIKRVSLPARDFTVLGPIFSHSSNILAREKAIVVNLEFIKAIVTADEVLLLDPLSREVLPFVDHLRRQFSPRVPQDDELQVLTTIPSSSDPDAREGLQNELPFEFQVLEIALETLCGYIDSNVVALEREAWPLLDELTKNVSMKNLEDVRSLKGNLTRLLARIQKVRDEIKHLLDDNEDMSNFYLTRKWIQNQLTESFHGDTALNAMAPSSFRFHRLSSSRKAGSLTSNMNRNDDVEELEMLLEAYFMQLERMRNKILAVREYIDDTEDYVNIRLNNQQNELTQLQLTLTIFSFSVIVEAFIASFLGMNIPCQLFKVNGIFVYTVILMTALSLVIFFLLMGYARWKRLLGS